MNSNALIAHPSQWPLRLRLLLFAFGDFAFNLYWQSLMLFVLFYYSDALTLPMGLAATIFMVGSIWDGIANFIAGIVADRRGSARGYQLVLMLGGLPLGLSFVLMYLPVPPLGWGIAVVAVTHFLFRTAYALVNVPYLAMTARISTDSGDRAYLAGTRMIFGTSASVLVALGTVPLGVWLTGSHIPPDAYLGAAILFAGVGTAILLLVGASYREEDGLAAPAEHPSVMASIKSLAANRAFVTLNLAMIAMIIAVTVLNKSTLYYFKYFLGDESAGQVALALMGAVSAAALLGWMLVHRFAGARNLWFLAALGTVTGLALFASLDIRQPFGMQLLFTGMQAMIVGLHFVFWTMLPNTIEFGQRTTGLRVEGAVFGLAALLQRAAIGVATAILGWSFGSAGYVANVHQKAETLAVMRWTIVLVPLGFLLLSCLLMRLNPLGKGVHAKIVRDLAEARG